MEDPHNLGTEFTSRFTREGDGYVFRARPWAAGYAFSKDEFEGLAGDYIRRREWMILGHFAVLLTGLIGGGLFAQSFSHPLAVAVAITVVLYLPLARISRHFFDSPIRQLGGRPVVVQAVPESERTRAQQTLWRGWLVSMIWPSLVFAAGIAVGYLGRSPTSGLLLMAVGNSAPSLIRWIRRRWFAARTKSAPET